MALLLSHAACAWSHAGLGATLLLLAMARKALPALPISISLAAVCYFLARFVMEPVFLPLTLDLIYF